MRKIFDIDGGLFSFLSKVADFMILNLLFLICSIPIVTIGASVTALSYVFLKMRDGEEGYISRSFFKSFRENFKQSTIIWLIMLALGLLLGVDYYLARQMEGGMAQATRMVVYIGIVIWLMEFVMVFPLQSRFYNSIKNTMKNALLLSLGNFPRTFVMLVAIGAAVLVTFLNANTFSYGLLIWILFGFSILAWINSMLFGSVFQKMMDNSER